LNEKIQQQQVSLPCAMCNNQTSSNEDTAGGYGNSLETAQPSSIGQTTTTTTTPTLYVNGHSGEGHQIKIYDSHRRALPRDQPLLIGIRGNWYDVTEYLSHHPGGNVLLDFAGRDATAEFLAYHDVKKVLQYRKPVGSYPFPPPSSGEKGIQADWLKLYDKYEELGYNRTPRSFIASRFAFVFGFLAASLSCVWMYLQSSNVLVLFIASLFLAGFWQQSGKCPYYLKKITFCIGKSSALSNQSTPVAFSSSPFRLPHA
jgi:Cytochrome b5-like Heme/Steroid binding domain